MPNESAFIRKILDAPDEDGPRLVYADWLEERGDPRGEFVRVQCELARLSCKCQKCAGLESTIPPHLCILDFSGLRRREQELLARHATAWLSPSPLGFGVVNAGSGQIGWAITAAEVRLGERYVPVDFRRGFVHSLFCDWLIWSAHAEAILAAHPVRKVTLTTMPAAGSVTGDIPFIKRLLAAEWPGIVFRLPPI